MDDAPRRAGHGSFEGIGLSGQMPLLGGPLSGGAPIGGLEPVGDPEEQWDRQDAELEAFEKLLGYAPGALTVFADQLEVRERLNAESNWWSRVVTLASSARRIEPTPDREWVAPMLWAASSTATAAAFALWSSVFVAYCFAASAVVFMVVSGLRLTWDGCYLRDLTKHAETIAAESSALPALAAKIRVAESPEVSAELQKLYKREIAAMKDAAHSRRKAIAKARKQHAKRVARELARKVRSEVDEATKGVRPVSRLNLEAGVIQDDVPRRD